MKKILPLTLLAVAAVFLLSSCDSMLEALFPKDTIGDTTAAANNTIIFDIAGYDYHYPVNGYLGYWPYQMDNGSWVFTNAVSNIYVELYDNAGKLVSTQTVNFSGLGGANYRTATATFAGLKDGAYSYMAWYDADQDKTSNREYNSYYGEYYLDTFIDSNGNSASFHYVNSNVTDTIYLNFEEAIDPGID